MRFHLFTFVLVGAVFAANTDVGILTKLKYRSQPELQGLYGPEDHVEVLHVGNFDGELYGKPHAWYVEFYNSWCGFCRKFAPEWVAFARRARRWRRVVRVGAIDCAQDENNGICREFEILGYPTVRYFGSEYRKGTFGESLTKGEDAAGIARVLAQRLVGDKKYQLGVQNLTSVADAWNNATDSTEIILLAFVAADSTVGAEIALDFTEANNVRVISVLDTSHLARLLSVDTPSVVFAVSKHSLNINEVSRGKSKSIEISNDVLQYLRSNGINVSNVAAMPSDNVQNTEQVAFVTNDAVGRAVFQADLEAALRYSLVHEIASIKTIKGEALVVFKNYLEILLKYFPTKANTFTFIDRLYESVTPEEMRGEDLSRIITSLEAELAPVYSTNLEWIGCKGSAPNLRGYTCALWTMFHVLTVGEARQDFIGDSAVLKMMLGYVEHFFGCAECSQHFRELAARYPFSSYTDENRGVAWLWSAHNQVNARLAGDRTDDPHYPKRQFPNPKDCPSCRNSESGEWDHEQVMHYCRTMYAPENVNSVMGIVGGDNQLKSASYSHFNTTLTLFLYVYCLVAFGLIVRLFFAKRNYKKKAYTHCVYGKV